LKIRRSDERNRLQPEAPCFPKADPSLHDNAYTLSNMIPFVNISSFFKWKIAYIMTFKVAYWDTLLDGVVERGVRFRKARGFWLQLVSLARPSNLQLSSKLPQSFKSLQNKTINKSYSLKGLLPTKTCPSFRGRSKSQLFLCKS
jgi:hypothetical protein